MIEDGAGPLSPTPGTIYKKRIYLTIKNRIMLQLTKKDAEKLFKQLYLPSIEQKEKETGIKDKPLRREMWNNYTDFLRKDGKISETQYNNWTQPKFCE